MGAGGPAVKSRRAYDGTRRQEQARAVRDRVVETAERLFLRGGYGTTTVAAIAAASGVSVDTIYKGFGGKPALVRAIHDRALRGTGPVPAYERSEAMQAREPDARKIVRAWGRLVTEIAPRTVPLLLLVQAAAVDDPELRSLIEELDTARLKRMRDNARRLKAAGHLRPGVSVMRAADVLWTYSSPELYELLVLRRGMAIEEYGRFVGDAMIAALL